MEEELKCPLCKQLFTNPVLLPCYHSLCLNCTVQIQQPVPLAQQQQAAPNQNTLNNTLYQHHAHFPNHSHASATNFHGHSPHIIVTTATVHNNHHRHPQNSGVNNNHHNNHHHHHHQNSDSGASSTGECSSNEDGSDKVSILSEADSGVIVCSSRPASYIGTPNMHGLMFPPVQSTAFCLSCPVCHKVVYFDEHGSHNLPKYRVMQNLVDRYVEQKNLGTKCQLCEKNPRNATVMCEQCEIFYCDNCKESCHPGRGPLAKHTLVTPQQGKSALKQKAGPLDYKCPDHRQESLNMYCMLCKIPVCMGCLQESRKHLDHDVQPIQMISKSQKVRFSMLGPNCFGFF